jgi:glycosyltransferase involved in cell wall biosynthesis
MTPPASRPSVAVVTPVFNEEAVLPELFVRLGAVFDATRSAPGARCWSTTAAATGSAELMRAHGAGRDPRFQLVELSRNFGFQSALSAGLAAAAPADAVVTMDADLQDPPEVIPELVAAWQSGAEVVRAVRRSRSETACAGSGSTCFTRCSAALATSRSSPTPAPSACSAGGGRGVQRAAGAAPVLPGLRAWIGFPTAEVRYDRQERAAGQPQQTFRRLVRYALDGLFSFSHLPLRAADLRG